MLKIHAQRHMMVELMPLQDIVVQHIQPNLIQIIIIIPMLDSCMEHQIQPLMQQNMLIPIKAQFLVI